MMHRWLSGNTDQSGVAGHLQSDHIHSKSNSYHGEPYIPADVFNELQNEVSSLLEFKNVLLQTFPDLHHKISSLSQLSHHDGRPPRNLKTEQDISDDIPSSWNVSHGTNTGSIPRRKLRKSPEGSSTSTSTVADSGFSTEKDISGGGGGGVSALLSPAAAGQMRWPGQERMSSLSSSPPPGTVEDELLGLLDVIHRKAVKLRAQQLVEAEWNNLQTSGGQFSDRKLGDNKAASGSARAGHTTLGAIHEHEHSDNIDRASDTDTKDRVRRTKLFSDTGHDREILVDRISELENEALSSNFKVSKLESEISRISRQKELLEDQLRAAMNIKSELDNKIHDMHSQYVKSSKKDQSGIIHSVQIVTGGAVGAAHSNQSLHSGQYILSPSRSETNLRDSGSVNIEIRQTGAGAGVSDDPSMSKSSEHLGGGGGYLPSKYSSKLSPSTAVSVVNLKSSSEKLSQGRSVDGLNALFRQRTDSSGSNGQGLRPSNSRFFANRIAGPPNVHKLAPQLNRVLSNDKLSPKSRSVENLYDQRHGLKTSNSEISLQPRALYLDSPQYPPYKLKSTQSEQVLTKIGRTEKVKLDAVMSQSVVSMPAELAKGFRVKPNREKIRAVLGTTSVLELQRQLLTTVMENEVYKSQMSRVTEGWNGKIDEFEKMNQGLHDSLSKLKDENELLRLKVEQKSIELEGTRARLRQLERTSDGGNKKPGIISNKQQQDGGLSQDIGPRLGHDNYVKFGSDQRLAGGGSEPRVTFDLASAKKAKMVEVAPAKMSTAAVVDIAAKTRTQLPSDAKQRLQEMAGYDVKRNYRKSSQSSGNSEANLPLRPTRLNLHGERTGKYTISPPSSPVKLQSPDLTSHKPRVGGQQTSLSRNNSRNSGLSSAKTSLMQSNSTIINNNNNNMTRSSKSSSRLDTSQPRHIVSNTPSTIGTNGNLSHSARTRTPSVERSLTSIKESVDTSKDGSGRQLPALPSHLLHHDQAVGLSSLELKHMGRETIAGLIAGILQKYTKKEVLDLDTINQGNDDKNPENKNSFVEIALADDDQMCDGDEGSRPVTALQLRHNGAGANSRQSHKSWEAFNHTEEMTQASHTMAARGSTGARNDTKQQAQFDSQESLTLPDSLNDFEGEEYQSPNLYREDSLGVPQTRLSELGSHHDVDSLQFQVSPTPNKASQSPVDSLIDLESSKAKLAAAEFFDSITSMHKTKPPNNVNFAPKRRIIPYCDNSLSSGTSAFTSQDVSFDSKDSSSSPSDNDRSRQIVTSVSRDPNTLYPDLTLAIHPIRTPPTPHNIPIHPLSRRYQTDQQQSSPQPQQRIENMSSFIQDQNKPQRELYASNGNIATDQVKGEDSAASGTQTKDCQQQLLPKSQSIKSATEKLKWKFLGW